MTLSAAESELLTRLAAEGKTLFAISRDLYDIHRLVQSGLSTQDLVYLLPEKFQKRGVDIASLDVSLLEKRHMAYELDWKRRLDYLIPESEIVTFEKAWQSTIEVIGQLQVLIKGAEPGA